MQPNFILIPTPDPLTLLYRAFPELKGRLDDGDLGAYYTYERFAEYLSSSLDEALWRRAYAFFELLAAAGGSLSELLVIGIFERLAASPTIAQELRNNAGPLALTLLDDMKAK